MEKSIGVITSFDCGRTSGGVRSLQAACEVRARHGACLSSSPRDRPANTIKQHTVISHRDFVQVRGAGRILSRRPLMSRHDVPATGDTENATGVLRMDTTALPGVSCIVS